MFSTAISSYLFCGGAGSGTCFLLAVLTLRIPHCNLPTAAQLKWYGRLFLPAYIAALLLLSAGALFLLLDLGRADRVLLLLQPRLTFLNLGTYALGVTLMATLMAVFSWLPALGTLGGSRRGRDSFLRLRIIPALLLTFSLVTMSYTGFMLSDLGAVPLWSTPALPALFILSSVSCGSAIVLAVSWFSGATRAFYHVMRRIAFFDVVIMVVELVAVGFFLVPLAKDPMTLTDAALAQSLNSLATGWHAPYFWVLFVVVGMIVPLALYLMLFWYNRNRPQVLLRASSVNSALLRIGLLAGILAGGMTLRWCVVSAGIQPAAMLLGGA